MRCTTLGFLLSALVATHAAGQQVTAGLKPNTMVSVKLHDGSIIYGKLERVDADSVVITAQSGRAAFSLASVQQVHNAGEAHTSPDGKTQYWFTNPNTTRLFFGPTGRTLGKGEGYVADHEVIFGSAAFGVTDRVTLGGGGMIVPESNVWFVTPKVGLIRSESFNLAVGALYGGIGSDETGGIAFLAGTYGSTDHSFTMAVGNAFTGLKAEHSQVIMLGGETRVSRRIALVTENYIFPHESTPLISYGIRILGEKTSVDLAFFNVGGTDAVFPGIPYVDFVIRW